MAKPKTFRNEAAAMGLLAPSAKAGSAPKVQARQGSTKGKASPSKGKPNPPAPKEASDVLEELLGTKTPGEADEAEEGLDAEELAQDQLEQDDELKEEGKNGKKKRDGHHKASRPDAEEKPDELAAYYKQAARLEDALADARAELREAEAQRQANAQREPAPLFSQEDKLQPVPDKAESAGQAMGQLAESVSTFSLQSVQERPSLDAARPEPTIPEQNSITGPATATATGNDSPIQASEIPNGSEAALRQESVTPAVAEDKPVSNPVESPAEVKPLLFEDAAAPTNPAAQKWEPQPLVFPNGELELSNVRVIGDPVLDAQHRSQSLAEAPSIVSAPVAEQPSLTVLITRDAVEQAISVSGSMQQSSSVLAAPVQEAEQRAPEALGAKHLAEKAGAEAGRNLEGAGLGEQASSRAVGSGVSSTSSVSEAQNSNGDVKLDSASAKSPASIHSAKADLALDNAKLTTEVVAEPKPAVAGAKHAHEDAHVSKMTHGPTAEVATPSHKAEPEHRHEAPRGNVTKVQPAQAVAASSHTVTDGSPTPQSGALHTLVSRRAVEAELRSNRPVANPAPTPQPTAVARPVPTQAAPTPAPAAPVAPAPTPVSSSSRSNLRQTVVAPNSGMTTPATVTPPGASSSAHQSKQAHKHQEQHAKARNALDELGLITSSDKTKPSAHAPKPVQHVATARQVSVSQPPLKPATPKVAAAQVVQSAPTAPVVQGAPVAPVAPAVRAVNPEQILARSPSPQRVEVAPAPSVGEKGSAFNPTSPVQAALLDHLTKHGVPKEEAQAAISAISAGLQAALEKGGHGQGAQLAFHPQGEVAVSIEPARVIPELPAKTVTADMDALTEVHQKGMPEKGIEAIRDNLGSETNGMSKLDVVKEFGHDTVTAVGREGYPKQAVQDVKVALQSQAKQAGISPAMVSNTKALQGLSSMSREGKKPVVITDRTNTSKSITVSGNDLRRSMGSIQASKPTVAPSYQNERVRTRY